MSHINQEAVVAQEIGNQDWALDISNDEGPPKCVPESDVEGKGSLPESHDGGVIHCLQTKIILLMFSLGW